MRRQDGIYEVRQIILADPSHHHQLAKDPEQY
jgi:hypothetical protein